MNTNSDIYKTLIIVREGLRAAAWDLDNGRLENPNPANVLRLVAEKITPKAV